MRGSTLLKSGLRLLAVATGLACDARSFTTDERNEKKHVLHAQSRYGLVGDDSGAPKWSSPRYGEQLTGGDHEAKAILDSAISTCRRMVELARVEHGVPGASFAIAVDGKILCREGLGYADVENGVPCTEHTVMRIASLSKPMAALATMQLWERGLLDLDAPVQRYVPRFPAKKFAGKAVHISSRHLLSHLGGIRHYSKLPPSHKDTSDEFTHSEYYIKDHYESVDAALGIFADDNLLAEPGKTYLYTTHGWTLLSAVVEKASGSEFVTYMKNKVFAPLGMSSTGVERHEPLLAHRSRYYQRKKNIKLCNAPYVDNSYKWAGGGIVSNVTDLVVFANALLAAYSFQPEKKHDNGAQQSPPLSSNKLPCREADANFILKPSTVRMMWKPVVSISKESNVKYAMGWTTEEGDGDVAGGHDHPLIVSHTGAAVGATSVLTIAPQEPSVRGCTEPRGVVVAVLFNLQEVSSVYQLGKEMATEMHRAVRLAEHCTSPRQL